MMVVEPTKIGNLGLFRDAARHQQSKNSLTAAQCLVVACDESDEIPNNISDVIKPHLGVDVAYNITVIAAANASKLESQCVSLCNCAADFDLILLPTFIIQNDLSCRVRTLFMGLARILRSDGTLLVCAFDATSCTWSKALTGTDDLCSPPKDDNDCNAYASASSLVDNQTPHSTATTDSEAQVFFHDDSCQHQELCLAKKHGIEDVHVLLIMAGFCAAKVPSPVLFDGLISSKFSQPGFLHRIIKAQVSQSLTTYTHPLLQIRHSSTKGRLWRACDAMQAGTIVLVDPAHATIPEPVSSDSKVFLICSNPLCNRRVCQVRGVQCPKKCYDDVVWCDEVCQRRGAGHHSMECDWLSQQATKFETQAGRYKFTVTWLVIRMQIGRVLDRQKSHGPTCNIDLQDAEGRTPILGGKDAIDELAGDATWFSQEQMFEWKEVVCTYLVDGEKSAHGIPFLPAKAWLILICQEETNSFGLYGGITGHWPLTKHSKPRGASYGAAVYPLASIANHSCIPNALHLVDETCRKIYVLSRSVRAGEEICISYFDLTEYVSLKDRNNFLYDSFGFFCDCARCDDEQYLC